MKVLLDENLPVKLKKAFLPAIHVYTVYDMKWNSLKNGELLKSIGESGFDTLVTSDKNIIHQHNLSKFNFRFIIIKAADNQYHTLLPLIPLIEEQLLLYKNQVVHISGFSN